MRAKEKFYMALVAVLLFSGCGDSSSENNDGTNPEITTEDKGRYTHKVINNMGKEVRSKVGEYDILLYSDSEMKADDKSPHKGVVVTVNKKDSELMPIQSTYMHKDIVAKVYEGNKLVTTTEAIEVTDSEPVVLIETEI